MNRRCSLPSIGYVANDPEGLGAGAGQTKSGSVLFANSLIKEDIL
jgi:hypothetical protein